jgi:hypothetical protein
LSLAQLGALSAQQIAALSPLAVTGLTTQEM